MTDPNVAPESEPTVACPICYEDFAMVAVPKDTIGNGGDEGGAKETEEDESTEEGSATENEASRNSIVDRKEHNGGVEVGDLEEGQPSAPAPAEGDKDAGSPIKTPPPKAPPPNERTQLLPCCHEFCRECVGQYLATAIRSKEVPVQCPNQDCQAEGALEMELVEGFLSQEEDCSELCETYQRLQSLADHPLWTVCTRCNEIVKSGDNHEDSNAREDSDDQEEETTDLTCPSCHHTFCRIHGDAHPGVACHEYSKSRDAKRQRKSEKALNQWTKPCSHCGARIQKSKGCDYIVCSNCRRDFCFRCGTHEHLTGTKVRRCAKCQTVLEAHCFCHPACECLIMLLVVPLLLVLFVLYAVLAFVVALLSCCCCGFYGLGSCLIPVPPPTTSTTTTSNRRKYAPGRGVLAVVAVIFLPFLLFVEAGVEARGGNAFLNDMLPPWFQDSVQEMPTHDPTAEDEEDGNIGDGSIEQNEDERKQGEDNV